MQHINKRQRLNYRLLTWDRQYINNVAGLNMLAGSQRNWSQRGVPIRPDDKGTIDDDENDNVYTFYNVRLDCRGNSTRTLY